MNSSKDNIDNRKKTPKVHKILIIVSFIIIIIWGIYFVIHVINTMQNNHQISNNLIYLSFSSSLEYYVHVLQNYFIK